LLNTWRIIPPKHHVDIFDGVPTIKDFGYGANRTRLFFRENSYYDEYVLDNGIVLQKFPQIDGFNGVPTVADFGTGKYRRQVIFDTSNPCTHYYLNGGNVKSCRSDSTVRAINGVPSASDFTDSSYIFDTSSPCDLYYLDGGNVKKCNPTVIAYTGKPPASAFSGGAEFIRDRSNPCDVYYLDSGTVTKCSSGAGGSFGVKVAGNDDLGNYKVFGETSQGVWETETVKFSDWTNRKALKFDLEGATSARVVIVADVEDLNTGTINTGVTVLDRTINAGVTSIDLGGNLSDYSNATLTLYATAPIAFTV